MTNATDAQRDALNDINRRQRTHHEMNVNTMQALITRKWATTKDGVGHYTGSQVYAITNLGRNAAGIEIPPPTPQEKFNTMFSHMAMDLQMKAWDLDSANKDVLSAAKWAKDDMDRIISHVSRNYNTSDSITMGSLNDALKARQAAVMAASKVLGSWDHDVARMASKNADEFKQWMKCYGMCFRALHVGAKTSAS
jgi:hypothetical protein